LFILYTYIIMNINNALATAASILGIYQMNKEVDEVNKDITKNKSSNRSAEFMLLSILINILWLIYQYRNGSIFFIGYSLLSLIVQLYVFIVYFHILKNH
jgi:hypothetical protein